MKWLLLLFIFMSCNQNKEQQQHNRLKHYTDSIATSINKRIDSLLNYSIPLKLKDSADNYVLYYDPATGNITYQDTLTIGRHSQLPKEFYDSVGTVIIGQ